MTDPLQWLAIMCLAIAIGVIAFLPGQDPTVIRYVCDCEGCRHD